MYIKYLRVVSYHVMYIVFMICELLIVYILLYGADMQKFPLRMKDNDLLVTELYKDPSGNRITALSVYLTQKASQFVCVTFYFVTDNWYLFYDMD